MSKSTSTNKILFAVLGAVAVGGLVYFLVSKPETPPVAAPSDFAPGTPEEKKKVDWAKLYAWAKVAGTDIWKFFTAYQKAKAAKGGSPAYDDTVARSVAESGSFAGLGYRRGGVNSILM